MKSTTYNRNGEVIVHQNHSFDVRVGDSISNQKSKTTVLNVKVTVPEKALNRIAYLMK